MAVYVDDMFLTARVGRIRGDWCHMMADSVHELDAMAVRIGLKVEWRQTKRSGVHYDVTRAKRLHAVRLGAIEIECGSPKWQEVHAEAMNQFLELS